LAEGGRIERLRLRGPWYSRPVAHHGRRLPELAENSRVERPPLRGSGFPGRSGSTSPCSPNGWPRAEESNPHPEGAPVLETGGGPSARTRGGAPGENRTHHELLCRQSLRQLASGANMLAGDQGFEPCRNGFGVRRSSSRVMPPVVRAAGLEPAREPGLSRPPRPIGLRAHGAGGRIRTDKHGGLSSADKPILVRRHNLVARPGFEPGKSLPSEGSAFTNLTSGPWCPRWDSNPQEQPSQDCASTSCATWT
jgi:hypothetical protein